MASSSSSSSSSPTPAKKTSMRSLTKDEETSAKRFLEEANAIASAARNEDAKTVEKQLKTIDAYLQTRTYFVTDSQQTEADVAMCKALNGVKGGVAKFAEIKRFVELMAQTNEASVLAADSSDVIKALGKEVEKMTVSEGSEARKISKGQA